MSKGVSEASVYKIRTWVHILFDLIVELLLPSVHPLDDYYQHLVVLFTSFSALQKMNGLHLCYDFLLKKGYQKTFLKMYYFFFKKFSIFCLLLQFLKDFFPALLQYSLISLKIKSNSKITDYRCLIRTFFKYLSQFWQIG